ncbi:hypothetical protein OBBRIDRAFT_885022 [Obba rivulosa]|uniref:Uncharacterized protein n=1 Tax=Obba rivulosa TaxID=1052685 RepID=A0A8E2DQR4_9APHY|nr:hypothetical protein OBBRIDRAFT_885022 [Obba rivulosa]
MASREYRLAGPATGHAGDGDAARSPPTNYGALVVQTLSSMTRGSGSINQMELRRCFGLSSSYLITDMTMDPDNGHSTWLAGFRNLVEVVVALHGRGELEPETVSAASKACSECWSAAQSWREMNECQDGVKQAALRLKGLLDANGKTYRGMPIYVPT